MGNRDEPGKGPGGRLGTAADLGWRACKVDVIGNGSGAGV